ncbi:MAG: redoxin domain-containing protein [Chitinophagaceae bacterium]|nr:MAG: redoxin domain-containing protein [Chitinophagaceae bacterium]
MKKLIGFIAAVAISATAFAQKGTLPIGAPFPDQPYNTQNVLTDKQETMTSMATDKGLLVVFTCNTCPFVIRNIDRTAEVLEFAKKQGVGIMLINSNEAQRNDADAADKMVAFAKKQKYPNYFIDKGASLADLFGASHTPEVFLFDGKTKTLVYKGAMDDNPADPKSAKVMYLTDAITNMVAGNAITPAETKSVGCSIKRLKS